MRVVNCALCGDARVSMSTTVCVLCDERTCEACMVGRVCDECNDKHNESDIPLTAEFIQNVRDNEAERRGMQQFERDMEAGYDTGWHLNPWNVR